MTERSVTHATFVIERTYDASPARVFAAWSEAEAKARWFSCHEERSRHERPPAEAAPSVDLRKVT